jgi:GTPase
MTNSPVKTRCGYAAIIGRPSVGKSTLLNALLGQKVSITARKPQTTRHRILGIKTQENTQIVYVDTPGILHGETAINKKALNRYLLKTALGVLHDVDVLVFMVEAGKWFDTESWILAELQKIKVPVILVINKIDQIKNKDEILPLIETLKNKMSFLTIIPLSAKNKFNIAALEKVVMDCLPENHFFFPAEQVTDRNERFLAAEIIREKLIRLLGEEVPYAVTVQIEKFEDKEKITNISAVIWVEKDGQKAIVIGAKGAKLKEVGTQARKELEFVFGRKIFLELWVKVKADWTEQERWLAEFGYKQE